MVGRLWRKLRRKQQSAWPLMEQGEYRSYRAVHPFDAEFGVDTSGLMYELSSGHQHDGYNNGYFAVAPSVFHAVMGSLRDRLQLDFERFTFIDVGAGKGRALLLASDYPFREIIGVELSPELDRIARANIAHYTAHRPHPPVVSILGDAADFKWPPGPLIVYMWNAFTRPVMERVFQNLQVWFAGHPQELYLVYMHPELESTIYEHVWLTRIWRDEITMSEEDYSAWAFPTRAEVCAVYGTKVSKTR